MATHHSILTWRIPWTEMASELQSRGSQRVGHDWAHTHTHTHTHTHAHTWLSWRIKTSVLVKCPSQKHCIYIYGIKLWGLDCPFCLRFRVYNNSKTAITNSCFVSQVLFSQPNCRRKSVSHLFRHMSWLALRECHLLHNYQVVVVKSMGSGVRVSD